MKRTKRDNLTKKEIGKAISFKTGLPTIFLDKFIEDIFEIIIEDLNKHSIVKIKNFGTLKLLSKKKRIGRNPIDGKVYEISPRNSVVFRPSKILKLKVNK